ncbi:MAG: hypothetical protein KDC54_06685 [Lewinella sp.]|nr:hypothetical protein [Lewinella sp.]
MKNTTNHPIQAFPGAGYLLGGALTILFGIGFFIWSKDVTLALIAAVPIGLTMGIALEQRFRQGEAMVSEKGRIALWGLLLLGVIVFFALLLLLRLI